MTEQQTDFLARMIRETREAAGLSRRQLAKAADVSEAYIESLETARRDSPTLSTLGRIADALGWDAARRASVIGSRP